MRAGNETEPITRRTTLRNTRLKNMRNGLRIVLLVQIILHSEPGIFSLLKIPFNGHMKSIS